jgi:hypothetical protein
VADANACCEGNHQFVVADRSDFANYCQDKGGLYADQNRLRGARDFEIISRDGDAGFSLQGCAQLIVRFSRNDFFRRTESCAKQPAND